MGQKQCDGWDTAPRNSLTFVQNLLVRKQDTILLVLISFRLVKALSKCNVHTMKFTFVHRFNKIAIQATAQMAADK